MKKIFFTTMTLIAMSTTANAQAPSSHRSIKNKHIYNDWRQSLAEEHSFAKDYADFKKNIKDKYGISYTFDVSQFFQRTSPNGKKTASQTFYSTSFNWDIFKSDTFGSGSIQAAFNATRYSGENAVEIASNSGFAQAINDFPTQENSIAQLTYTHQFAGNWDFLEIALGQFPIYSFDGNAYDSNQQVNFINYSLSQNGTSTYSTASLGGYATITPNDDWAFSVGAQDASNVSGDTIHTNSKTFEKINSFASITYSPQFEGFGSSEYSFLIYNQPSTYSQPQSNTGYSINLMQNIDETWAVFGRVNWTSDAPDGIDASYVIGGVMNNPLGRNELDQIGVAYAYNQLNTDSNNGNTSFERDHESTLEAYWAWGISNMVTITPDVQLYFDPGNNTKTDYGVASTLRLTVMF